TNHDLFLNQPLQQVRIDISALPAGLYFWRVEAGGAQVGGGKVVVY
ncbi:MAG: hypothetical protein HUU34_16635, partial [Saprospiraceae bacterium]|nr:hypothetical protein [Saprospiraceae bacterium]